MSISLSRPRYGFRLSRRNSATAISDLKFRIHRYPLPGRCDGGPPRMPIHQSGRGTVSAALARGFGVLRGLRGARETSPGSRGEPRLARMLNHCPPDARTAAPVRA